MGLNFLQSLGETYCNLLRRIEVEFDYLDYRAFYDDGYSETPVYGQHPNLPSGYWVYLYPFWYIWGEKTQPEKSNI